MTNLAIALVLALQAAIPGTSQDRLKVVSEDMVSVVSEEFRNATLKSGIKESDALAMLAAVAVGESNLRNDIENCKTTGDGGKSVGLGQVMRGPNWKGYTRKQICDSRRIQFKLALHVIDVCWTRNSVPSAVFRCYTSGDPTKNTYAARHEHSLYQTIKTEVKIAEDSQKLQTCYVDQRRNYSCTMMHDMMCRL